MSEAKKKFLSQDVTQMSFWFVIATSNSPLMCIVQLAEPRDNETSTQDAASDAGLPSRRHDVTRRPLQPHPARRLAGLQPRSLQPCQR